MKESFEKGLEDVSLVLLSRATNDIHLDNNRSNCVVIGTTIKKYGLSSLRELFQNNFESVV